MTLPLAMPASAPQDFAPEPIGGGSVCRPIPEARTPRQGLELSFEVFPPTAPEGEAALRGCVAELATLSPDFVSVTYGAGGSTRERTLEWLSRLCREDAFAVAGHLTCVGATRPEVDAVVQAYADAGVRRIVALRGDPADSDGIYRPHPDGYSGAVELVSSIARRGDFDISVGCYPEVHPQAGSVKSDIEHLKRKVDAGASRAISQFFFDPDVFLRFLDRVRDAGITVPVVPGILPVHNLGAVVRFARRCGASVPSWLVALFEPLEREPELRPLVAATVCAEMCARLREHGVREFHFYTMNRPQLSASVCHVLRARAGETPSLAQAVSQ